MHSSSAQWHVVPQLNHKCAGLYALKRATLTSCVHMLNLLMHAVLHSIIIITEIIPGRVSFIVTAFSNCSPKQNEGKIWNLILIGCRVHCYILLSVNLRIRVSSCNLSYTVKRTGASIQPYFNWTELITELSPQHISFRTIVLCSSLIKTIIVK